jgi:hypothetical protein
MGPWAVLVAMIAAINLFAFIAVRGRWGRIVPLLAVAALVGTAAGNAIGQRTGLEIFRLGDFHVIAASVVAQASMLAVVLLAAMLPARAND